MRAALWYFLRRFCAKFFTTSFVFSVRPPTTTCAPPPGISRRFSPPQVWSADKRRFDDNAQRDERTDFIIYSVVRVCVYVWCERRRKKKLYAQPKKKKEERRNTATSRFCRFAVLASVSFFTSPAYGFLAFLQRSFSHRRTRYAFCFHCHLVEISSFRFYTTFFSRPYRDCCVVQRRAKN